MEPTMECRSCGYRGDDVQDFVSTEIPGERSCPQCKSIMCYILECEACHSKGELHMIGGSWLCLHHADIGYSSDTTGEKNSNG